MNRFRALMIAKKGSDRSVQFVDLDENDLMDGDVVVRVSHSSLNYKDGLAILGAAPVIRRYPMIPGIDFAGVVERSAHSGFSPGQSVVLTGWGAGETHYGGYAQMARVPGDWLTPLPDGLSAADAMAIGTAGLTAALALDALERFGLHPRNGPALATGATGGLGSIAVALLAKSGWRVIASTGRPQLESFLRALGASDVIDRASLAHPPPPLAPERWAAGIDAVGSTTLASALASTSRRGAIAACGLAQGMDLPSSVAPFILRGVALLGIDSVMAPHSERNSAWRRLARDLDKAKLAALTRFISFQDVVGAARALMAGELSGRTVIEIG